MTFLDQFEVLSLTLGKYSTFDLLCALAPIAIFAYYLWNWLTRLFNFATVEATPLPFFPHSAEMVRAQRLEEHCSAFNRAVVALNEGAKEQVKIINVHQAIKISRQLVRRNLLRSQTADDIEILATELAVSREGYLLPQR